LKRTRILLFDMPRMLRDIVIETLAAEPDMEVAAEVATADDLLRSVERRNADVVVTRRDDSSLAALLLTRQPQLKVLAVADNGRESSLYEMRPQRVPLGEITPQRLVTEIRKAVHGGDDDA
jgi:DNA-binding NarL/FixJ family response regulator